MGVELKEISDKDRDGYKIKYMHQTDNICPGCNTNKLEHGVLVHDDKIMDKVYTCVCGKYYRRYDS